MEALDPGTRDVWQSLEPITREDFAALPLEPGWSRLGVGRAAMDEHWFARSPGRDEDGPMALREIGGAQIRPVRAACGRAEPGRRAP